MHDLICDVIVTVPQALLMEKLSVYYQIII